MHSTNIVWHNAVIRRTHRELANGHRSGVLWFTGLSGAGKSTLAHSVEEKLHAMGVRTYVLDGDNVRHGLCGDLGFSPADRTENIRRVGEVAKLFVDAGVMVLTAFISPFQTDRDRVRGMMMHGDFMEIYCRCDVAVCEARDVKGLYQRARRGEVPDFTGVSSSYEPPIKPELVLDTAQESLDECVAKVMALALRRGVLPMPGAKASAAMATPQSKEWPAERALRVLPLAQGE